ncbi:subclass B3 metallo-beta-lactamase [Longimicrobium terrae]|uniref:Metallo-beta-lactamase class B n=1 Tax=Longimicrobium terrae TaxID=1639882 RepID=A0A841H2S9_9BACT|nr:subclass B3 metallo-beta-lactamase [Longimicrobium terrae]MBB4637835.1 metallo-beta-lactamase class B [Longimicrobium terrae]MBB6072310.1 metallo-beta-lactamase class B [Longimicrobium terrae]
MMIAWKRMSLLLLAACAAPPRPAGAQSDPLTRAYTPQECSSCAEWNAPHRPVHLFGNTYYVGTQGLASILITSPDGHVLIDGALPNSAPLILANIRSLGFDPADVKLILNSHAHFDHSGGFAALQRATGAPVAASAQSVQAIRSGRSGDNDPQHGELVGTPPVANVTLIHEGRPMQVGSLSLTPYLTAGHTPGGTTWTWRSCEGERCVNFVYADSQTPISADGFLFSASPRYPNAVADFRRGYEVLERLSCDILITPHPGASNLWQRAATAPDGLIDPQACKQYAARSREQLQTRLQTEQARRN